MRIFRWSLLKIRYISEKIIGYDKLCEIYHYRGIGFGDVCVCGNAVVRSAPFWLITVMTISIIIPWLRLRKLEVRCEVLSKHALRMYFDYGEYPQ